MRGFQTFALSKPIFSFLFLTLDLGLFGLFFTVRKHLTEMPIRSPSRYGIAALYPNMIHESFGSFSLSKHRKLKLDLKAESQKGQAELSQAASAGQLLASYLWQEQALVLIGTWTCLRKRHKTRGMKRHLRTQAFHPG